MNVTSKVTINTAKLKQLTQAQKISLVQTADALLTDLRDEQYMPFDTGNLQNDSTFVDDSQKDKGRASIVSTTPYARRLYFHPEYNFRQNNNSKAGGKWFEPYISGTKKNFARDTFAKLFKRNGGL
jgi:hypothetical protein